MLIKASNEIGLVSKSAQPISILFCRSLSRACAVKAITGTRALVFSWDLRILVASPSVHIAERHVHEDNVGNAVQGRFNAAGTVYRGGDAISTALQP